jgi:hypothetical protein
LRAASRTSYAVSVVRLVFLISVVTAVCTALEASPARAQNASVDLIRTDVTKLNVLDASQWSVLGVRLGESKEAALATLRQTKDIQVKEDSAAGRIFVAIPPPNSTVVMSVKITENQVTAINLVGGFGEWLQGDTQLLFRAFEDDSLRYKLLGREDQRQAIQGGSKESPILIVTYAYFKEGLLLQYATKRSADGKLLETQREMVLIHPAKAR